VLGQVEAGIFGTGGQMPDRAVSYIMVADVATTCADADQLGGSVVNKQLDPAQGGPTFASLRDPSGNAFRLVPPESPPCGDDPDTSTTNSPMTCSTSATEKGLA
jgi:predicted enzyme related to lactoylglutathione lyase